MITDKELLQLESAIEKMTQSHHKAVEDLISRFLKERGIEDKDIAKAIKEIYSSTIYGCSDDDLSEWKMQRGCEELRWLEEEGIVEE